MGVTQWWWTHLQDRSWFPLDWPSPHILFNTIPPCPSQTREGMAVKEEEWREITFYDSGYLVGKVR